jgi:hypothetical protein
VVSLLLRLLSDPTEPLVTFPNLHHSLPYHLWLSSSPHSPGTSPPWRSARASPSAITGSFPGRASDTNRPLVSPIALLARLFASPCLTSPPASAPPPSGYGGEVEGTSIKF